MASVRRNIVRWTVIAVGALAAVILIAWIGGAFSGDDETTPVTLPPVDTAPPPTFETPDKPVVEIPEAIPTELVVTTLVEGEGPAAQVGDTVEVHYVGVLSADGTEFDNSYDRGATFPVTLGAGGVIAGWDEGLVGAKAGERRQLDIPAELAYGDTGSGGAIPPGAALTFVIDVLAVTPAGQ